MNFIKKLNILIRKPKTGIFEISRGKKLFNTWCHYILKYDFSNKEKPFTTIQIKEGETITKNLNHEEIKSEKWIDFISLSNSTNIIREYSKNKNELIEKWYLESKSINKFNGNWISDDVFKFVDNTNISNWIPYRNRDGEFKLKIEQSIFSLGIPVEYDDTGNGYLTFFDGRFELTHNYILVWQNEDCPIKLGYKWENKKMTIDNSSITARFVKE